MSKWEEPDGARGNVHHIRKTCDVELLIFDTDPSILCSQCTVLGVVLWNWKYRKMACVLLVIIDFKPE